ncbi:MAG TPA: OmpA family protein [Crocinitomicaceae bacterium]|nr:OmpA family protein [Crocinitomicaceae bacterium]
MRKIFLYISCILGLIPSVLGQLELTTNGSFDRPNICTEMNAKCAPSAWFLVSPTNAKYNFKDIGLVAFNANKKNVRQYLQQQLVAPLEKDKFYRFSITVWGNGVSVPSLGLLLSDKLLCTNTDVLLDIQPSVDLTPFIDAKTFSRSKKIVIDYTYKALGNEKFIIIGNFQKDNEQQITNSKKIEPYQSYYIFIDDVSLIDETLSETEETKAHRKYLRNYKLRHIGCSYLPFEYENSTDTTHFVSNPITDPTNFEIIVFDDILFETNSFLIENSDRTNIINTLKKIDKDNVKSIVIEGHTDNVGNDDKNLVLSQKRADAFMQIFMELEFSPDIISSYGRGETQPKFDNSTEEGRKGNRRIELFIEYK